jgi:hypothetical protein
MELDGYKKLSGCCRAPIIEEWSLDFTVPVQRCSACGNQSFSIVYEPIKPRISDKD